MNIEHIEEGFDVFVHDGDKSIGAVRKILPHGLVIYVENAGDFTVPLAAIRDVHSDKVVLRAEKLELRLKQAIGHAHSGEDPSIT